METNNDYDFQNFLKEMESQNFSEEYDLIINRVIYEFKQMKSQIIAETIETTKKHYETEIEKLKLRIAQLEQTDYQRQINELVHIIYELKKTIEETKMEVNCFKVKNTPVNIPIASSKRTTTDGIATGKNSPTLYRYNVKDSRVVAQGEGGTKINWKLFNDGTLVFEGIGAMYSFTNTEEYTWTKIKEKVKSIVVCSGITVISNGAFREFPELQRVIMCNGIQIIGNSAFSMCEKLLEISFPISLEYIFDSSFYKCKSLTKVEICSNSLMLMGSSCFGNCSKLTEVLLISNSLTEIGDSCFRDCKKLSNVTLPDSLLTIGSRCFYDDVNISEIVLGEKIRYIGASAFGGWTSLQKIKLKTKSKLDFSSCYSSGYKYCRAIIIKL